MSVRGAHCTPDLTGAVGDSRPRRIRVRPSYFA